MKQILCLFVICISSLPALADSERTILYQGTARMINLADGSQASEQVLLKKIYNSQNSSLTEVACFKDEGKPAAISPVYMRITGSKLQISDNADFSTGKLTGVGELQGPSWDWTYLKWSMQYQTPAGVASVEDANFVVGKQLIGRKQLFFNGRPFRLWEIEMTEVNQADFDIQSKTLGCPEF